MRRGVRLGCTVIDERSGAVDTLTLLIIIIVVLVLLGGGGYWYRGRR